MSERGSFCTEYMYCPECRKKMEKVLCTGKRYLHGYAIADGTIIAGYLGSCGPGGDVAMIKYQTFNKENAPCHEIKVAIIPEGMPAEIFIVKPDGSVDDYEGPRDD